MQLAKVYTREIVLMRSIAKYWFKIEKNVKIRLKIDRESLYPQKLILALGVREGLSPRNLVPAISYTSEVVGGTQQKCK